MTDEEGFSPEFERAVEESIKEFNAFDETSSKDAIDLQMTAKGVKHSDIIQFAEVMHRSYIGDLEGSDERVQIIALSAITQLAFFAGQNFEKHRQEEFERLRNS